MWRIVQRWLQGKTGTDDDARLRHDADVGALRLALGERERSLAEVQAALEQAQAGEAARVEARVHAALEPLAADLATPVAQLLTQAHLVEVEGKPVRAADVLGVARRLVTALEDHGLAVRGAPGEVCTYDPALHEPFGDGPVPEPGAAVRIRFVGVSYAGRLVRRAAVEAVGVTG